MRSIRPIDVISWSSSLVNLDFTSISSESTKALTSRTSNFVPTDSLTSHAFGRIWEWRTLVDVISARISGELWCACALECSCYAVSIKGAYSVVLAWAGVAFVFFRADKLCWNINYNNSTKNILRPLSIDKVYKAFRFSALNINIVRFKGSLAPVDPHKIEGIRSSRNTDLVSIVVGWSAQNFVFVLISDNR